MEKKIEYGLICKGDYTDILDIFNKKKVDFKLIAFGTTESDNYTDWYFLLLGIGIGLRAKGLYGKELKISNDTRVIIWTIFSLFIMWLMLTIVMINVL